MAGEFGIGKKVLWINLKDKLLQKEFIKEWIKKNYDFSLFLISSFHFFKCKKTTIVNVNVKRNAKMNAKIKNVVVKMHIIMI